MDVCTIEKLNIEVSRTKALSLLIIKSWNKTTQHDNFIFVCSVVYCIQRKGNILCSSMRNIIYSVDWLLPIFCDE